MTAEPLELIDHHVHGAVVGDLDRAGFESMLTEGPGPRPAGTSMFDSQLGFAVRRWCAPVLDLEPSVPAAAYMERRIELGTAEVNRRLLRAAQVRAWLVDTGYQSDQVATPEQVAEASGAPALEIVRLEAVAERVIRGGTSAADFAAAFSAALATATRDAVGLKSIVAYRLGLDFEPGRPGAADVVTAAGALLRAIDADPAARLDDEVLLRHLIWTGVDTGLPLQFHVGFGDPDVRLHRADPSLMHDFLLATRDDRHSDHAAALLPASPAGRVPGQYLPARLHGPRGDTQPRRGAFRGGARRGAGADAVPQDAVLVRCVRPAGTALPGRPGFRRDFARVTGEFVADGAWSAADAGRVAELVGSENARRVYRLGRI